MPPSRTEGAPAGDSGIPNILYTHGHATHDLVVPRRPWQRYLAEFLGTFAIVFIGCGSVIGSSLKEGAMPPVGITLAFGFIVAAMIYALGPISAAHFNPAVTIAFATIRRFPWRYAPAYWIAQISGAVTASGAHQLIYGDALAAPAQYGATVSRLGVASTCAMEIVLTFLLMLVVTAVATDNRISGPVPGLAIGLTVVACAICGGPATGASMNPVRSLAPALFAGGAAWRTLPVYCLAPIVGAVLGAQCYELLRDGAVHAQSAPADLEDALRREPGLSRLAQRGEPPR